MKQKFKYLMAFCIFLSCKKSGEKISETDPETNIIILNNAQRKSAGIITGKIKKIKMSSEIHANGVLDVPPQNLVTVSALMGGFIKTTKLLQGMKVKKGEIIATVQNPDFIQIQQEYLANVSKLKFAYEEFKREEELSRENVSALKTFQQVSSEYHSLKALNSALIEKLSLMGLKSKEVENGNIKSIVNVMAPINGYVTAVNVNIGKFVNPGEVICEIVNTEHLHVELTVFEKDVTKLKPGQNVRFSFANEGEKEMTAKIYLINRKIAEDRTVRVHAHLDKEDPNLIPNMYLHASIEINEDEVFALPENAIVAAEGKHYIFLPEKNIVEGEFQFVPVEIIPGVTQKGYTEVKLPEGFDINREIVIQGSYDLLSKKHNVEEE